MVYTEENSMATEEKKSMQEPKDLAKGGAAEMYDAEKHNIIKGELT